ncbi:hypothetical protein ABA31_24990 [Agrococcus baldri]|uniref:DUF2975 domain-containing protein n=1 Tax=Agrococcus baldri TaxID=153730 RepID=A0AA87USS0_9MICO|nr:hypothetical protein ABA31_24990 [Agrococcus baldri]
MLTEPPLLRRSDRVVLRVLQILAWVGAAVTLVSGAASALLPLLQGMAAVPLTVEASLPETTGVIAQSPQWLQASVWIDGQQPVVTALVIAALLVRVAATAVVLMGIALLAGRMLRGRAFADAASAPLGLVLVGVAAGPILGDALEGWASMLAWEAMGTPSGFGSVMAFSPTAILFGLVVVAVMILFRVASRVQRDADGLV